LKAARVSGIGVESVRQVPVDASLRLDAGAMEAMVADDRREGLAPFLVAGTAGTTNAGVIDPLSDIAGIAERAGLWFHADAAWGGAAALSPNLGHHLSGIERADSITFDAHKWLSAPMGAGVYITRHPNILTDTFSTPTAYMPKDARGLAVTDPHLHSMQWSRRFIGLKVFLSLLVAGWDGYAAAIDHMTAMGDLLRDELAAAGWKVVNGTPLPVVCFLPPDADPEVVARRVVSSGAAWISTTRLAGQTVLRACITNYRTSEDDIHALVKTLRDADS
jgi:glutamate/tyrosine decarboxylase-like PLP-dependent enzyme